MSKYMFTLKLSKNFFTNINKCYSSYKSNKRYLKVKTSESIYNNFQNKFKSKEKYSMEFINDDIENYENESNNQEQINSNSYISEKHLNNYILNSNTSKLNFIKKYAALNQVKFKNPKWKLLLNFSTRPSINIYRTLAFNINKYLTSYHSQLKISSHLEIFSLKNILNNDNYFNYNKYFSMNFINTRFGFNKNRLGNYYELIEYLFLRSRSIYSIDNENKDLIIFYTISESIYVFRLHANLLDYKQLSLIVITYAKYNIFDLILITNLLEKIYNYFARFKQLEEVIDDLNLKILSSNDNIETIDKKQKLQELYNEYVEIFNMNSYYFQKNIDLTHDLMLTIFKYSLMKDVKEIYSSIYKNAHKILKIIKNYNYNKLKLRKLFHSNKSLFDKSYGILNINHYHNKILNSLLNSLYKQFISNKNNNESESSEDNLTASTKNNNYFIFTVRVIINM